MAKEYSNKELSKIASERRKKKQDRLAFILGIGFALCLVINFFSLDFFTIKRIEIHGFEEVAGEILAIGDIKKNPDGTFVIEEQNDERNGLVLNDDQILSTNIHFLIYDKKAVEDYFLSIPGISECKVKCSLKSGVKIEVKQEKVIAFMKEEDSYQLIFQDGSVGKLVDMDKVSKIKALPQCFDFTDLKEFASVYALVDESARSNFSDIKNVSTTGDPGKIAFYSNDGKVAYCRLNNLVNQLNNYNKVVRKYPDNMEFDFVGDNIYIKKVTEE